MRKLGVLTAAAALVALMGMSGTAWAATLVVNDATTEAAPCDVAGSPGPPVYDTIQEAIDDADPGDTVAVCPGTYTEDLTITKDGLELKGSGSATTTIVGVDTVPAASFPLADPNIDIMAERVSIHGFTFESPVVAADEYSSGIVLTGRDNKIYDNEFFVGTGDISQGIQTYRDDNAPPGLRDISGLHIHHNSFTHLAAATGTEAYEAIFLNHQSDATDPNNPVIIGNNTFSGNLLRAVTTERSHTTIRDNTLSTDLAVIFGVFPRGIQVGDFNDRALTGASVHGNTIGESGTETFVTAILVRDGVTMSEVAENEASHAGVGIRLEEGADDNIVRNNGVGHSGTDGILIDGNDNDILRNTPHHSGDDGIEITGDDNDINDNNSHHNVGWGINVSAGSGNSCDGNKLKKNGAGGKTGC